MSNYTARFSSKKNQHNETNNSIFKSATNLLLSGKQFSELSLEHLLNKISDIGKKHDSFLTQLDNVGIAVSSLEEKLNSITQLSKLQQNCIEAHENELSRHNEMIKNFESKFENNKNTNQPSIEDIGILINYKLNELDQKAKQIDEKMIQITSPKSKVSFNIGGNRKSSIPEILSTEIFQIELRLNERINANVEAIQKLKEELKKIDFSHSQLKLNFDSSFNFLESKMEQKVFDIFSNNFNFCKQEEFGKLNNECNQMNEKFTKIIVEIRQNLNTNTDNLKLLEMKIDSNDNKNETNKSKIIEVISKLDLIFSNFQDGLKEQVKLLEGKIELYNSQNNQIVDDFAKYKESIINQKKEENDLFNQKLKSVEENFKNMITEKIDPLLKKIAEKEEKKSNQDLNQDIEDKTSNRKVNKRNDQNLNVSKEPYMINKNSENNIDNITSQHSKSYKKDKEKNSIKNLNFVEKRNPNIKESDENQLNYEAQDAYLNKFQDSACQNSSIPKTSENINLIGLNFSSDINESKSFAINTINPYAKKKSNDIHLIEPFNQESQSNNSHNLSKLEKLYLNLKSKLG